MNAESKPKEIKPQVVLPGLDITLYPDRSMKLRAPNVLMFFMPVQVDAIKKLLTGEAITCNALKQ